MIECLLSVYPSEVIIRSIITMKVTVNQKNFRKALGLVEKIVSRNPSLPILNNVLIKTDNGRLRISSTNLEIGINCMIGAKIDEVGELAGVYANLSAKKLTFAATDSFRLSEVNFDAKISGQHSVIIPRNTVMELIRITSDIDGDIEVKIGDNQVSFYNNDFELVSRLIDGNYPDYKKVIPSKFLSRMLVQKGDLEKDIRDKNLLGIT